MNYFLNTIKKTHFRQ